MVGLAQQLLVMVREVGDAQTAAMPSTSQHMPLPAARWFPLVLHSGLTVAVDDLEIDDHSCFAVGDHGPSSVCEQRSTCRWSFCQRQTLVCHLCLKPASLSLLLKQIF